MFADLSNSDSASIVVIGICIDLSQEGATAARAAVASGYCSIVPITLFRYLRMGDGRLAAPEFQKLIDHPAIIGRNDIGALSYLQLGTCTNDDRR
jgi:hypothetical protein